MEAGALFSVCSSLCFLGTVVGGIIGVVILLRRKYGDQDAAED